MSNLKLVGGPLGLASMITFGAGLAVGFGGLLGARSKGVKVALAGSGLGLAGLSIPVHVVAQWKTQRVSQINLDRRAGAPPPPREVEQQEELEPVYKELNLQVLCQEGRLVLMEAEETGSRSSGSARDEATIDFVGAHRDASSHADPRLRVIIAGTITQTMADRLVGSGGLRQESTIRGLDGQPIYRIANWSAFLQRCENATEFFGERVSNWEGGE